MHGTALPCKRQPQVAPSRCSPCSRQAQPASTAAPAHLLLPVVVREFEAHQLAAQVYQEGAELVQAQLAAAGPGRGRGARARGESGRAAAEVHERGRGVGARGGGSRACSERWDSDQLAGCCSRAVLAEEELHEARQVLAAGWDEGAQEGRGGRRQAERGELRAKAAGRAAAARTGPRRTASTPSSEAAHALCRVHALAHRHARLARLRVQHLQQRQKLLPAHAPAAVCAARFGTRCREGGGSARPGQQCTRATHHAEA